MLRFLLSLIEYPLLPSLPKLTVEPLITTDVNGTEVYNGFEVHCVVDTIQNRTDAIYEVDFMVDGATVVSQEFSNVGEPQFIYIIGEDTFDIPGIVPVKMVSSGKVISP